MIKKIELLAPAKDFQTGKIAIDSGADAIYIGAHSFSARAAASNPLSSIQKLIDYAHIFYAKVYVTVNTIIYDNELKEVEKLINNIYNIGADAIIIQDFGIFKMDLPPIPIFASTQTHNYHPERIKFLDEIGVKRIILARELSLDKIKEISNSVKCELEFFIHGALCVCFSGQCNLSFVTTNRSANRGECSQPCRLPYSLIDSNNKILIKNKHLLSLKDLNLSEYLTDLIDAGITSFKIEGRLKDTNYVKNVTAFYRKKIDEIIKSNSKLNKSSSGITNINFEPDLYKSFNRGFTTYFIKSSDKKKSSFHTPKSIGEPLGKVTKIGNGFFEIKTKKEIINGDGICFITKSGTFEGTNINKIIGNKIYTQLAEKLTLNSTIYRNYDHKFNKILKQENTFRKIQVNFYLKNDSNNLTLSAEDEDGITATSSLKIENKDSSDFEKLIKIFEQNLRKTGDTIFTINKIIYEFNHHFFIKLSDINKLRWEVLDLLKNNRLLNYKRELSEIKHNIPELNKTKIDYLYNVANKLAKEFYLQAGVKDIEDAIELQKNFKNKKLMTTKYCIKNELDICPLKNSKDIDVGERYNEQLFLQNGKNKFRLSFDCKNCEMSIFLDE